jgi:hypothetical protein
MKTASTFKQSGKTFLETGSLCEFLGKKNKYMCLTSSKEPSFLAKKQTNSRKSIFKRCALYRKMVQR